MTANGKKPKAEPAPPTTLFLFGAHGDLVKRLLMPALYNLSRDGLLGDGLRIVGVDHNAISDADFAKKLEDFIRTEASSKVRGNAENALDPALWARLAKGISYVEGDFLDDSTYADIASKIADSGTANAVFYLATAPRFFSEVVQRLGSAGLLNETDDGFRRVVIEKPFGSDLATAEALNACLLKVMSEKQIYRIDHYLGKETVQNILVSRFSNVLFEAFWNNHYIDHVQITAAETVGVETRATSSRRPAHCGTWCPTICSNCWQWSPWSRRQPLVPTRLGVRRPKWSVRSAPGRWKMRGPTPCAANTPPEKSPASHCPAIAKKPTSRRTAAPRRSSRSK